MLSNNDLNSQKKVEMVRDIDEIPQVKEVHYKRHLYPFLLYMIEEVVAEQHQSGGESTLEIKDQIDDKVDELSKNATLKVCYACGNDQIPKSKINCPTCHMNLKQSKAAYLGIN